MPHRRDIDESIQDANLPAADECPMGLPAVAEDIEIGERDRPGDVRAFRVFVDPGHHRWFLERVCDDLYAIVGGTLRHLPGGVDEYLAIRAAAGREPGREPSSAARADPRAARKELARIERRLSRIATEEAIAGK